MKPENLEVIMRIDFSATDGEQIVAHAEKVQVLVRCGECKFYDNDFGYCVEWQREKPSEWFCADGERREG